MACLRISGWTRWASLAALVLATLAPTLSHAMASWRGDAAPWSQLCSASPAGAADAQRDAPRATGWHCAFCALQAADPVLPACETVGLPGAEWGAAGVPRAAPGPGCSGKPWVTARPRGPPVDA